MVSPGGYVWLGNGDSAVLATAATRLGARVIDIALFGVIWWMISATLAVGILGDALDPLADPAFDPVADQVTFDFDEERAEDFLGTLVAIGVTLLVAGVVYEVAFTALKGQTPGKMMTRIKVVNMDDGQVPGWGRSLGRWGLPALPVFIPFLGLIWAGLVYLSITWDPRVRGWHDKAVGTLVVKVERERRPMA